MDGPDWTVERARYEIAQAIISAPDGDLHSLAQRVAERLRKRDLLKEGEPE